VKTARHMAEFGTCTILTLRFLGGPGHLFENTVGDKNIRITTRV